MPCTRSATRRTRTSRRMKSECVGVWVCEGRLHTTHARHTCSIYLTPAPAPLQHYWSALLRAGTITTSKFYY